MPYQATTADPVITFDLHEAERQVATVAKNQAIGGQAAWSTFVNGLTAAQQTAAVKALLNCFKFNVP